MSKSLTKKIATATLALSALAGVTAVTLTATAGTTLVVSALTATSAHASQCVGHTITGFGGSVAIIKATRKTRATRRAIRKWSRTARQFGSGYGNFANAKNAKITCRHNGMECTVTGIPCKG